MPADRLLVGAGYEVHEAGDGDEALKISEELDIDVMVCDLVMPSLPGRWQALAGLLLFGLAYTAVWTLITWHLLQDNERFRVKDLFSRFFTSFPKWKTT